MVDVKPTPTYLLLEHALGEKLADYVQTMRADDRSWPYIAKKIRDRTEMTISAESLRQWFPEFSSPGVTSPAPGNGECAA